MEFLGFGPPNQLSSYEMKKILGQGGFGTVSSFKDKRTDQDVAIKIIYITSDSYGEEGEKMVQREVSIQHHTLEHPNIVKYHECWEQDSSSMGSQIRRVHEAASSSIKIFCFKMNLYDCSLKDWLKERNADFFTNGSNRNAKIPIRNEGKKGYTSEYLNKVLKYFKQILDAVEYYQSLNPPVMHCNLKPENILYEKASDSFLISDFGLGRMYYSQRPVTRGVGTFLYAAPEQRNTTYYNKYADYYPLGIILYEMLFPLQKGKESLRDKLDLLEKGKTDTACEAMFNTLPDLCSLITKIVGFADPRPELTEIFQVIHSQIIDSFLNANPDWILGVGSSLDVIDQTRKTILSSFTSIRDLRENIESSLCQPIKIMQSSLRDIHDTIENNRASNGKIETRLLDLNASVEAAKRGFSDVREWVKEIDSHVSEIHTSLEILDSRLPGVHESIERILRCTGLK